jgi:hypothetical protein
MLFRLESVMGTMRGVDVDRGAAEQRQHVAGLDGGG